MHIQMMTFQLQGISQEDYQRHAAHIAPVFARLPGLIAKVWLADPTTNTFGGVYAWEDRTAMERYREGEVYAAAATNPGLAGFADRDFAVLAAPTHITGVPLLPNAATRVGPTLLLPTSPARVGPAYG